jgi:uncharacterized membrane protein YqjE
MDRLALIISGFTGAAGRISGMAGQVFQDRLELLALELREAKIRFIQAWLLACMGMVFFLLGLLLLVAAGVYMLAPELRLYGIAAAGAAGMLIGIVLFIGLRRHLERTPLAFDQSLAELKKDTECFSTKK